MLSKDPDYWNSSSSQNKGFNKFWHIERSAKQPFETRLLFCIYFFLEVFQINNLALITEMPHKCIYRLYCGSNKQANSKSPIQWTNFTADEPITQIS